MDNSETSSPPINALPPMICANPREKILPEEIPTSEIVIKSRKEKADSKFKEPAATTIQPVPLYPLTIAWTPPKLMFEIKEEPVVQKMWICNSCSRSIYVHCCELWDETAYLGARWRFYPQTRFLLAPGLTVELFLRACPKEISPVPCAYGKLQLAAAYKRDHVTGYFAVPVDVKFLNFIPFSGEGGE